VGVREGGRGGATGLRYCAVVWVRSTSHGGRGTSRYHLHVCGRTPGWLVCKNVDARLYEDEDEDTAHGIQRFGTSQFFVSSFQFTVCLRRPLIATTRKRHSGDKVRGGTKVHPGALHCTCSALHAWMRGSSADGAERVLVQVHVAYEYGALA